METAALVFTTLAFIGFSYHRLRRYLHIFQQEEYDSRRFFAWLLNDKTFDKRLTAGLVGLTVLSWMASDHTWPTIAFILFGLAFLIATYLEPNPEHAAKKKLAMTERAKRILHLSLGLCVIVAIVIALANPSPGWTQLSWIILVQLIPALLAFANWLLIPVEARIQRGFRSSAEARLAEVSPITIGITGSFGKTSVKHILGHVLQMNTNTLFTPGSVNTVMGISRIINEQLQDNCRYFLVEMGAYGTGSIARLCKFTPPDHGIITSIGAAHYERFKDIDTVARAKFELAEAVTQRQGHLIIHESVLDQPYAKSVVDKDRARFVVVGDSPNADVIVRSVTQSREGLHVSLEIKGETHTLFAPLFGHHHAHNMALSFAFAADIGLPADRIIQAMRSTPQISHRLELKSHASGALYLDDAYNSNPQGFANALDLLDTLKRDDGRRILVTPGMAELGTKHDEAHQEIGRKTAQTTDLVLAIKPERIPTLLTGIREAAGKTASTTEVMEFERFLDAQTWLNQNLKPSDTVLIENDLPDLYEREFIV